MKLWFDAECKKQKRIANDAKKVFNRYPGDESNRVIYFREKKIYKTILKKKKELATKRLHDQGSKGKS